MDIFMILTLLGGLAFFLYGMTVMSSGLEKMSGSRLETSLKKATSNKFKSIVMGAGVTIAIQSSSALTVMLVGLVNSGIMQLGQTVGVIMGSNIGTTLTAWLFSLVGIETDNVFINLLKPDSFSPIFALIGVILMMASKSGRKKDIGKIMVGFAILMTGMSLMSDALKPLAEVPEFQQLLVLFDNPVFGVLIGLVVTGIIQSSAASVGILQSLSATGGITYGMAFPIIMGQNIGTCVTSLISSIGTNKNAKRVATVHILFNVIGTIIFLLVFYGLDLLVHFAFMDWTIDPFGIALLHSIFNVTTTLLLIPFSEILEKLARFIVRDSSKDAKAEILDERLLLSPAFAITESREMTEKMACLVRDTLYQSMDLIRNFSEKSASGILEAETQTDTYEDKLGSFLIKVSSKSLTEKDSHTVSKLLHLIGDFERIGDHAVNLVDAAREVKEKKIKFSDSALNELGVIEAAVKEIMEMTIKAFTDNDLELAARVEPLEQVIDELRAELKTRHINRLTEGRCTVNNGFVYSDILTNYERISDHCSNIAVCMIQISEASFDTHGYLNELKNSGEPNYKKFFEEYQIKYSLPDISKSTDIEAEEN